MDGIHNLAKTRDSLVKSLFIGEINIIVTLHTDTVDGYTSVLHLLHHRIDTLTLTRINGAIVVIDQHTCRVSLAGKLESLGDELVATELEVLALTIRTGSSTWTEHHVVVGDSLVHNVPCIYHILIAVDYSMDMIAQTLVEHLLLHGLTLLVGKHPVGKLRVPAQTVTTHLDTVLTAEVSNLVGFLKVPNALLRMDFAWFPVILGSHTVKLLLDNLDLSGISHIRLIDSHTNREVILIGILQTRTCGIIYRASPLCKNGRAAYEQYGQ